jgi:sulfatase maturation enzyme AslB (radical SAM superfamily)
MRGGCDTFDRVIKAVEKCKEHKVEFNVLVLPNNVNVEQLDEIFDFFIENGIEYILLSVAVTVLSIENREPSKLFL